jgi:hypothetical protein
MACAFACLVGYCGSERMLRYRGVEVPHGVGEAVMLGHPLRLVDCCLCCRQQLYRNRSCCCRAVRQIRSRCVALVAESQPRFLPHPLIAGMPHPQILDGLNRLVYMAELVEVGELVQIAE